MVFFICKNEENINLVNDNCFTEEKELFEEKEL